MKQFIVVMLLLPIFVMAAEKIATAGGTLRILSDEGMLGAKKLMLNNRILKTYHATLVSFEKSFTLRKSTLVIISENMGGSGTISD
jgi:hypothetical protein